MGVVSERCNDIAWLSVFVFYYGMSLNPSPIRIILCSSVVAALQVAQVFFSLAHQSHSLVELSFFCVWQALHKLIVAQSLLWEHVAIVVLQALGL